MKTCKWFLLALTSLCIFNGCKGPVKKGIVKSALVDSVYNFGHITTADTLKHTFYIKSTGTADLKIDTIAASCDCMSLSWQKKPIKPGDTGFINIAVSPSLKHKGRATKFFMVKTNADKPLITFQIFFDK